MGADIQSGWQHAMIKGVKDLSGAPVHSTDIRTGASLIIARLWRAFRPINLPILFLSIT